MRASSSGTKRVDALVERFERTKASDRTAALPFAIELIAHERVHRLLEPSLDLLLESPSLAARPALRERFVDLTDTGVRYDQDCSLRVRIVKVLRAIESPEDVDLAERGVRTIQLQPPARIDVAQGLRGQSLLWLAERDPVRAEYLAVELLQDPHESAFSGEPAVTAIQVLAARGQVLPIWALARRPGPQPDVLAQAFASLRHAPADLQWDALRDHLTSADERGESGEGVALVAAEAIVLNRLADGYDAVRNVLQETPNLNLFTVLAMTVARSGDDPMRERLHALHANHRDLSKATILDSILGKSRIGKRP